MFPKAELKLSLSTSVVKRISTLRSKLPFAAAFTAAQYPQYVSSSGVHIQNAHVKKVLPVFYKF